MEANVPLLSLKDQIDLPTINTQADFPIINTRSSYLFAHLKSVIILSIALQSYGPYSDCSPCDGEHVYEVS